MIFWLEHEALYMNRLYKKNFQIPSVGKGGRLFFNFSDFFKKNYTLDTILEILLKKVWEVGKQSPYLLFNVFLLKCKNESSYFESWVQIYENVIGIILILF